MPPVLSQPMAAASQPTAVVGQPTVVGRDFLRQKNRPVHKESPRARTSLIRLYTCGGGWRSVQRARVGNKAAVHPGIASPAVR